MIVGVAEAQLLILFVDARADLCGAREVEGRAVHRAQLARRDRGVVRRREARGIDLQAMAQDVAAAFAREIEVGVVRQVHNGRLVCDRIVVYAQFVIAGERIDNFD